MENLNLTFLEHVKILVLFLLPIAAIITTFLFVLTVKKNNFNLDKTLESAYSAIKSLFNFMVAGFIENIFNGQINWLYIIAISVTIIIYLLLGIAIEIRKYFKN